MFFRGLVSIFCALFSTLLFSTTAPSLAASAAGGWAAAYGGAYNERANSIQQTADGGYIVAGETESFGAGGKDLWVLKLRPDGAVEWQKTYGGRRNDWAESIQQTSEGGYVVAGYTNSFGVGDFWVLKLRADGTVEWQKTYGRSPADLPSSIQQTGDGGYIVAGWTASGEEHDIWVLKLRADGTIEWQKVYGGAWDENVHDIHQTLDGGYIVAGMTRSFGAGAYDFWVLKLQPDGTVQWQKSYGRRYDDWPGSIQQTLDGGYIVAGMTVGYDGGIWALKLKPNGNVEWEKIYGEVSCGADAIQQTRDGGYIVAGRRDVLSGMDLLVLKLGSDGTVEWQKTCGRGGNDLPESIQQTSDGGYVVTGCTSSFGAGQEDLLVLKLRPDGSIDHCDLMRNIRFSWEDSNALVLDTSADAEDSNVNPQDSTATIQVTEAQVNIYCQSPTIGP